MFIPDKAILVNYHFEICQTNFNKQRPSMVVYFSFQFEKRQLAE